MKKLILLLITIISIFAIYFFSLDRKTYYLVLGDDISLGITDTGKTKLNYAYYVQEYLQDEKKLEKYVNAFAKQGYRITDIINDIKNNKIIYNNKKKYTLKNSLIKADLVTISINNQDVVARLNSNVNKNDLYNWVDCLGEEYEEMIKTIREYCKEEIIVIGYYYPSFIVGNEELENTVNYLNNCFKEISKLYNIKYIDISQQFMDNNNFCSKYYPTETGYEEIAKIIIKEIKDSE